MYTLLNITTNLSRQLSKLADCDPELVTISLSGNEQADLSCPLFRLASTIKQKPSDVADHLVAQIEKTLPEEIKSVESVSGYINFRIDWSVFARRLHEDFTLPGGYGHQKNGDGKVVIVDLSSPNIAKPFSVGHLRSTIIGDSLVRHFRALGYSVIGDNHLGDWGTQFGKLIVAYKKWGDAERVAKSDNPIKELNELYVRFHEEIGGSSEEAELPVQDAESVIKEAAHPLIVEARQWFRKLEQGDVEAVRLWKLFSDLSLKQFSKVYEQLGFKTEEALGESFYNDKMLEVVEMLEKDGYLQSEEGGAKIIQLDDHGVSLKNFPRGETGGKEVPLLIMKEDGGTVYATRDLACALYRQRRWNPDSILYVVGKDQELYFKQIIPVMGWLGVKATVKHVAFGLVRILDQDSGKAEKMSTRRGKVVLLEEVLLSSVEKARAILDDLDRKIILDDQEKAEVARIVGIGAVKFNDLGQERSRDLTFDWNKMLNLDGYSGPSIQYAAVRAKALLRKGGNLTELHPEVLGIKESQLLTLIARFPATIEQVVDRCEPHIMAQYLFETAQAFGSYYNDVPILGDVDIELRSARLWLVSATNYVIEEGLRLLGIETPDRM